MTNSFVKMFDKVLSETAPYMSNSVPRMYERFGSVWEERFGETLEKLFPEDDKSLRDAVKGYVRFALDATKLQKRFEVERQYIAKTYEEAANAVYHNQEYMIGLYLPGILFSHFLWPHHYAQLEWFHETFAPLVRESTDKRFYDVGVGTGFYGRQVLAAIADTVVTGVDISRFSLEFSKWHIDRFGLSQTWNPLRQNILEPPALEPRPFFMSVEVLEHLEDPLSFIKGLRKLLAKGGYGFITAAINAPNEDHIYLYTKCSEVVDQLAEGGFEVVEQFEAIAYEPRADEPVPALGAFIVK